MTVKTMAKCAVLGCEEFCDPRWYVHSISGPLPACDGHGCVNPCECHKLEFRPRSSTEEEAMKESRPQPYRMRRGSKGTTSKVAVVKNGFTVHAKYRVGGIEPNHDGVHVARTFEELINVLWRSLHDTRPHDTCPYGALPGRENG
ncbi:hypothetical protein DRQ25_05220 [Candidatus Fermentibacteria bacterium]|nr:MAG: hypothetical protein DRQ25_05220 [Candidatus Fermentibacteria bacterium]